MDAPSSPHRGGPEIAQARFAAALLAPGVDARETLAADATPRGFDVHRNTVVSSLVRALAEGFPSVERLVGDEFFAAMAAEAVRAAPPTHPVLLAYGAGFAAFIEAFAPVAHLPYLADVARLDGLRRRAWHAADVQALDLGAFTGAEAGHVAARRIALHPSVGLLGSAHPARTLWAAQNGDEHPAPVAWVAETALVWRSGGALHVDDVDAPLLALLDHARHRPTLAELLSAYTLAETQAKAQAFATALRSGLLVDAEALDAALAHAGGDGLFDGFLPRFPTPPPTPSDPRRITR